LKPLHQLAKRAPRKRFDHRWELATDPRWLRQAGEESRSNTGSMTAGIDSTVAIDITPERIPRRSERLRTGQYRPQPVRWVDIAKANGKRRPLGLPPLEERIVPQALRMLMEPLFEADFSPCAPGFRRHRRTHTAFRQVARMFPRTTWTIEGDIVGCCDHIPHGRLLRAVESRMADAQVRKMIRAFLAAGYLQQWQYHRTDSGTPQSGVLSPRLCNVFGYQLDEYMRTDLRANQTPSKRGENARRNPEYRKLEPKIMRLRRQRKQTPGTAREAIITELTGLERHRRAIPYYAKAKQHPSKIGYTRYADDALILLQGTKAAAQAIKEHNGKKLHELGVALSEETTKLTHWRDAVNFLGYQRHSMPARKGTSLWPILCSPRKTLQGIKAALRVVGGSPPHPRPRRHHPAERQVPRLVSLLPLRHSTTSRVQRSIQVYRAALCPLCRPEAQAPYGAAA
jgi:RNA-directed DNA polymerase